AADGNSRARDLVRDEHGSGDIGSAAQPCGSNGDRRTRERPVHRIAACGDSADCGGCDVKNPKATAPYQAIQEAITSNSRSGKKLMLNERKNGPAVRAGRAESR